MHQRSGSTRRPSHAALRCRGILHCWPLGYDSRLCRSLRLRTSATSPPTRSACSRPHRSVTPPCRVPANNLIHCVARHACPQAYRVAQHARHGCWDYDTCFLCVCRPSALPIGASGSAPECVTLTCVVQRRRGGVGAGPSGVTRLPCCLPPTPCTLPLATYPAWWVGASPPGITRVPCCLFPHAVSPCTPSQQTAGCGSWRGPFRYHPAAQLPTPTPRMPQPACQAWKSARAVPVSPDRPAASLHARMPQPAGCPTWGSARALPVSPDRPAAALRAIHAQPAGFRLPLSGLHSALRPRAKLPLLSRRSLPVAFPPLLLRLRGP